ncbi:UDP-N-acetylmuramoyl-L-alanyl-D-glutamate--2,6-diaminopimelate ligase [Roseateles sp. BYS180W]|uniref:UDP-N-acetylmuramoyl-L-alanyl-D-glutamate--2,6-diaminopimelate ligase n=1 Tax=Roseateles rivi TaxID=3299028 RepID=A0ABW7FRN6_9BURK
MLTRLKSPSAAARWLQEWTPSGRLVTDSRAVRPGDAFIAWPGYATDARQFVAAALQAGAATCLVEEQGVEAFGFTDARVAALPDLKARCGEIAADFYQQPSAALEVVAVTGTNGKTSSAWWVAQVLSVLGSPCGMVGTLGVGRPPVPGAQEAAAIASTGLTTPDPVRLQAAFAQMRADGLRSCAIEASSIGIEEHRLAGVQLRVAMFTNFTQDHLDYHGDMAAYWQAKRKLFAWAGLQAAVLNLDDAQGQGLAAELGSSGMDLWTYGIDQAQARLQACALRHEAAGLAFTVVEGAQQLLVQTALIGRYNVSNLLGVMAAARALGHSLEAVVQAVQQVSPVPGRMQRVGTGQELPQLVVDYAHTPDALEKALQALRPLAQARGGRLHVVFGCGGNRDPLKRPQMGAIAAQLADEVILTSDNPRDEDPELILDGIAAGMPAGSAVLREADRARAIAQATARAASRDVVLVAGKGHEDYQEVAGQRRHFCDIEASRAALLARAGL